MKNNVFLRTIIVLTKNLSLNVIKFTYKELIKMYFKSLTLKDNNID